MNKENNQPQPDSKQAIVEAYQDSTPSQDKNEPQGKPDATQPAPERKDASHGWDDGRIVADMNITGFNWHDAKSKKVKSKQPLNLTRKEKWALFWGSVKGILPYILCATIGLFATFFLIYLWLT